ncbi:hypothetical protein [Desulfatitalea alkaliphila]|uniref:Uncharacterized protein n=1 Tax=Desulfatitalea alkaliphila TaxID=2929485 RepID=A0AA41R8J5_9BACT|nr:hypothetical protein [Desulfatitalea alkaliphila]MCJ8500858.1 hypothetical protein [Desulfatitalea alkaliphila]
MGMFKDAMSAVKAALVLAEKVDQTGATLSELVAELRDHDRRLVRLETIVEFSTKQIKGR